MFIWSCPPSPGDDYIFYCHPLNQKTPKAKRLCDWYKKVADQSAKERTIHSYKVGTSKTLDASSFYKVRWDESKASYFYKVLMAESFSIFYKVIAC